MGLFDVNQAGHEYVYVVVIRCIAFALSKGGKPYSKPNKIKLQKVDGKAKCIPGSVAYKAVDSHTEAIPRP
jgi:hypothetical protein